MGLPKVQPVFSVEEYLVIERTTEDRHEYLDGQVFAMAGESIQHGDISMNVATLLHSQLRGKPCRTLAKDTKVRSGPSPRGPRSTSGLYSYPDVVVVCDEPEFHDDFTDIILNPTVIVEVLSPSTEFFDRGDKRKRYQKWNQTLRDYLLVSQEQPEIEHHWRGTDGRWTYQTYTGLDAEVAIPSIECTLKLVDVYDRVVFPPGS